MSNLPVIGGTYADLRQVKSRGVWQVVIDVPSEDAEKLVELFGLPRQDEPTWLAIARLKVPPGAGTGATHGSVASPAPPPPEKPANAPGGAYAKRAGILCNNPRFQAWIGGGGIDDARPAEDAADLLRWQTDVASRRDYDSDPAARQRFLDLETRYLRETGQFAEERHS
jgi:hypothetical protein